MDRSLYSMPMLSIITIHLNDPEGLCRTYESLRKLLGTNSADIEWIVIDGGSNSSSCGDDFFKPISEAASEFVSEPDDGIYHAMNKGVGHAKGEYALFLNAGDELHPQFDVQQLQAVTAGRAAEMVWGRCLVQYENGSTVQVKTRSPSWTWYGMPVPHPAIFFRREVLGHAPFNTRYRIGADYDLVCRLVSNQAAIVNLDALISIFFRGGLSDVERTESLEEENEIRLRYFAVPAAVGSGLKQFKKLSARMADYPWLRSLWRKWI